MLVDEPRQTRGLARHLTLVVGGGGRQPWLPADGADLVEQQLHRADQRVLTLARVPQRADVRTVVLQQLARHASRPLKRLASGGQEVAERLEAVGPCSTLLPACSGRRAAASAPIV